MNGEKPDAWHRNSRFYRIGSHALYLAGSFVYIAFAFHPELVEAAFGVFGGIGAILLGGGTWTNLKERDVQISAATNPAP